QKMAFGLHKIIVVGGTDTDTYQPSRYGKHLQILDQYAFGNFRPLLNDITRNARRGFYLAMVGSTATPPNEHYAPQLLHLLSVGLERLDPGGVPLTDGSANLPPTCGQWGVAGSTKAFTGWNLAPQVPAPPPLTGTVPNYHDPIVPGNISLHDQTAKRLLALTP